MSSSERPFGLPRFLLPLAQPSKIRLDSLINDLCDMAKTLLLSLFDNC